MAMLGWVIMGLAIWHFTIWLPDQLGRDRGCLRGVDHRRDRHRARHLRGPRLRAPDPRRTGNGHRGRPLCSPGALLGIAVVYLLGLRSERHSD